LKSKLHPDYKKCIVSCACGNTFETRSTQPEIHVEICSMCHPFYTGKQKLIDSAGRVEQYNRRYNKTVAAQAESAAQAAAGAVTAAAAPADGASRGRKKAAKSAE
jgi:large subunit ribosomal protein L31